MYAVTNPQCQRFWALAENSYIFKGQGQGTKMDELSENFHGGEGIENSSVLLMPSKAVWNFSFIRFGILTRP